MSKRPKTTASLQHLAGREEIDGTMTTNGTTVIGAPIKKRRAVARRQASQITQRIEPSAPLGNRTAEPAAKPASKQAPERHKVKKNPKAPKAAKVKRARRKIPKRPRTVGHSILDFLPRLTGAPFIISVHVIAAGVVVYFAFIA